MSVAIGLQAIKTANDHLRFVVRAGDDAGNEAQNLALKVGAEVGDRDGDVENVGAETRRSDRALRAIAGGSIFGDIEFGELDRVITRCRSGTVPGEHDAIHGPWAGNPDGKGDAHLGQKGGSSSAGNFIGPQRDDRNDSR